MSQSDNPLLLELAYIIKKSFSNITTKLTLITLKDLLDFTSCFYSKNGFQQTCLDTTITLELSFVTYFKYTQFGV